MLEVTKDAFYAAMGPLNVHPSAQTPYYQNGVAGVSLWKIGGRDLIGKTCSDINQFGNTLYPLVNRYYFTTEFSQKVGNK